MSKQKLETLKQKFDAIQKIGTDHPVSWTVARVFAPELKGQMSISGNEICLGGDYVSIEDARYALEFYVRQLGGSVKWQK
jgi:hypothetical protein